MQPRTKIIPANSSFGFIFRMVANGGGTGLSPKTYSVLGAAFATNQFLLGATDDNVAGVTLGWPSDPGDSPDPANRVPPTGRVYDADVSPNNIRLSQVSLQSLRMTHGIRAVPSQPYLPSSFAYQRDVTAAAANDIIGDFSGCKRVTVQLIADAAGPPPPLGSGIVANGLFMSLAQPVTTAPAPTLHTFHLSNLGDIQVVNLSAGIVTIGVHVETDL